MDHRYVKKLLEMPPVTMAEARGTSPPGHGVYLISNPDGRHLYVGMAEGTQGIRGRIGNQWTEDDAVKEKFRRGERKGAACTLPINMALEELGLEKRDFSSPEFGAAVVRHMEQVPDKEVRWVAVPKAMCREAKREAIRRARPRYNGSPRWGGTP